MTKVKFGGNNILRIFQKLEAKIFCFAWNSCSHIEKLCFFVLVPILMRVFEICNVSPNTTHSKKGSNYVPSGRLSKMLFSKYTVNERNRRSSVQLFIQWPTQHYELRQRKSRRIPRLKHSGVFHIHQGYWSDHCFETSALWILWTNFPRRPQMLQILYSLLKN